MSRYRVPGPGRGGGGPGPRRRTRPLRLRAITGWHDPYSPVTRAEVLAAVARGSHRAESLPRLLGRLRCDPRLEGRRAHHARNLCNVLAELGRHADWNDAVTGQGVRRWRGVVSAPRARIAARCGISVSTFKACRAELEDLGYLAVVRDGFTPHLRPGKLTSPGDPGLCAVWVLTVPFEKRPLRPAGVPGPETRPLPGSPRTLGDRTSRDGLKPRTRAALDRAAHFPAQVAVLRKLAGQGITDKAIAVIAGPFLSAGGHAWPADRLAWALQHLPGGGLHPHRHRYVRRPAGWLRYRLGFWLGSGGMPEWTEADQGAMDAAAAAVAAQRADSRAGQSLAAAAAQGRSAAAVPLPLAAWLRDRAAGISRPVPGTCTPTSG